jgi:hypothetical protein
VTTIIETTQEIIEGLGLEVNKVSTPPGYAGLSVALPNDSQAFFIWSKMDGDDYHFRIARFWANDNPFSMFICPDLISAIAKTKVLTNL